MSKCVREGYVTRGQPTRHIISNNETHAMYGTGSQIMSHAQAAEQSHLLRLQINCAQAFDTCYKTLVHHQQQPSLTLQVFEATGQQKQQGRLHG